MVRKVFKGFEYREFRILWLGACTSSVGTWMQKMAQSWLVLQISGSSFYLGLDQFLGEIPIFLFSLVGGVVADRMDRRKLLLVSQFIQMSCSFLLAALFAFGVVHVWHILCLSFIVGLAQSFGGPAYQALIPTLVKQEDLSNAIALNSIQFNLARVVGPVLGGLALTKLGAQWCFALNGLSFIAVIFSLLVVHTEFVPKRTSESILVSMKQGVNFIRGRQGMTGLIALAFLMTMLGIPLVNFLPVFAKDVLHQGPDTFTVLLSVSGVGSIFGALTVAGFGQTQQKGKKALLALVGLGALIVMFSYARTLVGASVALFFAGAALISVFALISSLVQLITTDDMRGRVMSVYNVAFRGGMPFGSLIAGWFMQSYSAPQVLAVNGVLLAILGLYYLIIQRKVAQL